MIKLSHPSIHGSLYFRYYSTVELFLKHKERFGLIWIECFGEVIFAAPVEECIIEVLDNIPLAEW